MHKIVTIAAIWVCTAPAWAADNKLDSEARARVIAPFLDKETVALGHVDLTRVDPKATLKKLAAIGGVPAEDLGLHQLFVTSLVEKLMKAGGKEIYVVVSLADLQLQTWPRVGFLIVPLEEGADADALAKVLGAAFEMGVKLPRDKAVFGGTSKTWERLKNLKPTARPEIAKAFAAAGDTAMQLLLVPTRDNRRAIEEMLPQLPPVLGGGPSKVLTEGIIWAAVGVDVTPKVSLTLVVQSKDAGAATALHTFLGKTVKSLSTQKGVREVMPDFARLVTPLIPQVTDDQLTAKLAEEQLAPVLRTVVAQVRGAVQRETSASHLRNIAIAIYGYLDLNKAFPGHAIHDRQGKPLLSWRVLILPFIGQDKLYKEFHLDEPWDSEHNKKLIARMPAVFASANRTLTSAGKTRYLVPLGKDTMFPDNQAVRIRDVTDGTANTILIVEALETRAVIWTKPEDLEIDPKKPHAGLVDKNRIFLAAFADASAHFLRATLDPKTLYALFTRNGGEVIGALQE